MRRHRRGRALRRRYGRSLPDPAGQYAQVQRMMRTYAQHAGIGAYVANSAIPSGRAVRGDGIWMFWVHPFGASRSQQYEVSNSVLRSTYAKYGAA